MVISYKFAIFHSKQLNYKRVNPIISHNILFYSSYTISYPITSLLHPHEKNLDLKLLLSFSPATLMSCCGVKSLGLTSS